MFTAKQYRAKAAEDRDLLDAPCSPAEAEEPGIMRKSQRPQPSSQFACSTNDPINGV
jgi:hypothetical protein